MPQRLDEFSMTNTEPSDSNNFGIHESQYTFANSSQPPLLSFHALPFRSSSTTADLASSVGMSWQEWYQSSSKASSFDLQQSQLQQNQSIPVSKQSFSPWPYISAEPPVFEGFSLNLLSTSQSSSSSPTQPSLLVSKSSLEQTTSYALGKRLSQDEANDPMSPPQTTSTQSRNKYRTSRQSSSTSLGYSPPPTITTPPPTITTTTTLSSSVKEPVNRLDDKRALRKFNHNVREKRRQRTINQYIDDIKSMLPSCRGTRVTKGTILRQCTSYLDHLHSVIQQLRSEINQLKGQKGKVFVQTINEGDSPSRMFTLLVSVEGRLSLPRRLDVTVSSIYQLQEALEIELQMDLTKFSIGYQDANFNDTVVLLTNLDNLPSIAKLIIRPLIEENAQRVKQEDNDDAEEDEDRPSSGSASDDA